MAEIQGEAVTGYAGPDKGPFKCGNCEYFKDGSCGQSTMMKSSEREKMKDGRVAVDADGCCTFFHSAPKRKHWIHKR